MRCETVGSQVLVFVCDAGGNNARLMSLLRDRLQIPEDSWFPIKMVRTINPCDLENRFIYLFHCSTHILKAMRNALYTSKKQFLDENGIRIGKAVVEECFQRDRERELRNKAPLSEVRGTTVILNKWSRGQAAFFMEDFSRDVNPLLRCAWYSHERSALC